jgi:uncharacterized protein (UPF0332 family)
VSPRSRELLARAREGIASARTLLAAGHWATAVSTAYYAMLYVARAALSERDLYGRGHMGTWQLFRETFVLGGQFDADLAAGAQRTQQRREASDYGAQLFESGEATEVVAVAERFVESVATVLLGEEPA